MGPQLRGLKRWTGWPPTPDGGHCGSEYQRGKSRSCQVSIWITKSGTGTASPLPLSTDSCKSHSQLRSKEEELIRLSDSIFQWKKGMHKCGWEELLVAIVGHDPILLPSVPLSWGPSSEEGKDQWGDLQSVILHHFTSQVRPVAEEHLFP